MDSCITTDYGSELIAIYLFYDIATGVQARLAFSDDFKHCNTIIYDGKDYVLFEFDHEGIKTRVIKARSLKSLVKNLKCMTNLTAMVVVEVAKRKAIMWKPLWARSCNELSRYTSGVDVGFTFNPSHFYTKLLRYDKQRNYEILTQWRRN